MKKLHIFYPENDLALAHGGAHYTPPTAAARLRNAGATLPLFYGNPADAFVAHGVNAQWLAMIRERLGVEVEVFRHDTAGYTAAPWGWSAAARQLYIDLGFKKAQLPDDAFIALVRELSHRRTAARVSSLLSSRLPFAIAPAALELNNISQVEEFVMNHSRGTMLKLPWSSSGRGLMATDPSIFAGQKGVIEGMINRQGSVMAEPRHKSLLDFAMLFTMEADGCRFDGYSVFTTTGIGSYAGNILAPQDELAQQINTLADADVTAPLAKALCEVLSEVARGYEGPLGVDMMIVDDSGFRVDAVVEINFRMTMGHLCRIVYQRYIAEGAHGTFSIIHAGDCARKSGFFDAETSNGQITGGAVDLAQPGSDFSFVVNVE